VDISALKAAASVEEAIKIAQNAFEKQPVGSA
jgi:hypothetical protein